MSAGYKWGQLSDAPNDRRTKNYNEQWQTTHHNWYGQLTKNSHVAEHPLKTSSRSTRWSPCSFEATPGLVHTAQQSAGGAGGEGGGDKGGERHVTVAALPRPPKQFDDS